MNDTLTSILDSRFDLSDFVFHFTKGSNAKQTLTSILKDKKVMDKGNKGVLCFTEAPLPSLVQMFDVFSKYNNPMYAPYGIAIPKTEFFDLGGRPVIYGPKNEITLLDSTIRWRFEEYYPNNHDYMWLREWRLNKPEILLDNAKHFVITKTIKEELEHSFEEGDIDVDGCVSDGQFWPSYSMEYKREWKSISIESLRKMSVKSRVDLNNNIDKQTPGELTSVSLGS